MSVRVIAAAVLAPPAANTSGFHLSTTAIAIIVVLVVVGVIGILGWRAPDRSPGIEEEAQRDRIED